MLQPIPEKIDSCRIELSIVQNVGRTSHRDEFHGLTMEKRDNVT